MPDKVAELRARLAELRATMVPNLRRAKGARKLSRANRTPRGASGQPVTSGGRPFYVLDYWGDAPEGDAPGVCVGADFSPPQAKL